MTFKGLAPLSLKRMKNQLQISQKNLFDKIRLTKPAELMSVVGRTARGHEHPGLTGHSQSEDLAVEPT